MAANSNCTTSSGPLPQRRPLAHACPSGQEHELLLYSQLQRLGVPFWSEAQLRSQGLHKTPDVRLQVGTGHWTNSARLRTLARAMSHASNSHVLTHQHVHVPEPV